MWEPQNLKPLILLCNFNVFNTRSIKKYHNKFTLKIRILIFFKKTGVLTFRFYGKINASKNQTHVNQAESDVRKLDRPLARIHEDFLLL